MRGLRQESAGIDPSSSNARSRRARRPLGNRGVPVIGSVVLAVGGFWVLQRFDVGLMRWRSGFMPVDAGSFWDQILLGFQDFAQVLTIATTLVLVGVYDRRRTRIIIAVLAAQLLANIGSSSGKRLIGRYRPDYAMEHVADLQTLRIEQTWLGCKPGSGSDQQRSFPSGHSASAFALAGVLAWFYPGVRWMLWVLAIGCATSRYLHAVHWPSDCLIGAAIGYVASQVVLWFNDRQVADRTLSTDSVRPAQRRHA